ncbi:AAA family ATPase [Clostridium sp. 'deep sea']|uniref:helix-turn-helix transcriptional regulator n=1 Tax=Clostridium sp. 'deep sea' TaxID=2779445 RepID=UPI0018968BCF|nr:helix-turn-helix transcriptional regulator [Clostridium sp. 'deep sea']QOR33646.1 AAA family ATPase [Clostridium sp. 'deep sea']
MSLNNDYLLKDDLNTIFVARENEKLKIINEFDAVLKAQSSVVFISGVAGIGKTFLVNQVIKDLDKNKITYVSGKYRHYDTKPLIAIEEIITEIVKHLLTLPSKSLYQVKEKINKLLGSNINIITSISDYSQKLFGNKKPVKINSNALKYKVKKSIIQFIDIASQCLFPLIIFIDDLQWADSFSLEVSQFLINNIKKLNVMLVVSYRNSEFDINKLNINKNKNLISYIALKEIQIESIIEYYSKICGYEINYIDYLSRFTYSLTLGNPYYIKEITSLLINEKILLYDKKQSKWVVDMNNLSELTLSSNAKTIIENRIAKISDEEKKLLNIMGCLDGVADFNLLKLISQNSDYQLNTTLNKLKNWAFLYYKDNKYYLSHDILLDIIYSNLTEEQRHSLHFDIAVSIKDEKLNQNNMHIQLVVSQILRSKPVLLQSKANEWVEFLYNAEKNSMSAISLEQYTSLFNFIIKLISYSANLNPNLLLHVNLNYIECLLVNNKYELTELKLAELMSSFSNMSDQIKIMQKYMIMYGYKGSFKKELKTGLKILKLLNYKLNIQDYEKDLLLARELFTTKKIADLISQKDATDKRILIIIETLAKMTPSANCVNKKLFELILLRIGILSVQYGKSPYSVIGYGAYSFILYNNLKDYQTGEKLIQTVLQLLNKSDDSDIKSFVYSFVGTFIKHWSEPLTSSIFYLEKGINENIKSGKLIYGGYSIVSILYAKYAMAVPFTEIKQYLKNKLNDISIFGDGNSLFVNIFFLNYLNYLELGELKPEYLELKPVICNELDAFKFVYYFFEMQRFYFSQDINEAYNLVVTITALIDSLKGHIIYPHVLFMCALVRLNYHHLLHEETAITNKQLIISYKADLEVFTKLNKVENYSRYKLIEAEYCRLFENKKNIDKIYYEANNFAEKNSQYHIAAIGNLLTANYYDYNPKLVQFYVKESINNFKLWGADYIANVIAEKYVIESALEVQYGKKSPIISDQQEVKSQNLLKLNNIEKLNEQESIFYFIENLPNNNSIDYVAILFEKEDEMYLHYHKEKNNKTLKLNIAQRLNLTSNISHKVVRYVARTAEDVLIGADNNNSIFANTLAHKDDVNILSMPIKYLDVLVGVVYIETKDKAVFNSDFIMYLKTILQIIVTKLDTLKNINIRDMLNSKKAESELTQREIEVLQLVANGLTNSLISQQLHISLGTVKNHLSNIYSKLEVDSRIKAVIKAAENQVIKI